MQRIFDEYGLPDAIRSDNGTPFSSRGVAGLPTALDQKTPHEFYELSSRRLPEPWWGKDFEYDMEAEALRVSKDGQLATHRGAFFLSTTLAHELIEIDWYEGNPPLAHHPHKTLNATATSLWMLTPSQAYDHHPRVF